MKRTKRLMATMILAAIATLGTPQAFAGIMIDDVASTRVERNSGGIGILDIAGHMLGDIVGIMIDDIAGIMIDD